MESTNLNVVALIQSRLGSTRLPRKALLNINGRTPIEWINYRLSFCKTVSKIALCTSETSENNVLAELGKKIGLDCFRGSEADLISRILGAAQTFEADAIIRITGDCPLVDPSLVDKMVRIYRQRHSEIDYLTNIFPPTFPHGLDVEILPLATLLRLDREVKDPVYREWITTTILENPDKFRIINITNEENFSDLRLTIDYQEDLDLVRKIFSELHREKEIFCLPEIVDLFKHQPELKKINIIRSDNTVVNNYRSKAFNKVKSKINK